MRGPPGAGQDVAVEHSGPPSLTDLLRPGRAGPPPARGGRAMSTPRPHTTNPPTPRQLRYLRDLAFKTGQTFTYPRTAVEASRSIELLKDVSGTPAADRRRESRELRRDMAERRGGSSRVDPDLELEGYGSTAAWSTFVEDEAEEEARERAAVERARAWR